MDDVFKDPVNFKKGINLRELMSSQTEFQIDMDFKKKPMGALINGDDDLFPDIDDEDDSDSEDILKNIEQSTEHMMLSSPEYQSFEDMAVKMVDCVASGDVKVLIIEEGEGPLVPVDAEVSIHYAAYWEKAKIPFDSTLTMNYGKPTKLRLGCGKLLPGLEIGLTTVRGPTARIHLLLQPAAAWGPQGVPPRIKPAPCLFVIVLYSVRDVQAAARFNDLPRAEQLKYEVTLRTVTSLHTDSKDLFTRHKYIRAIRNYQQSISILNICRPDNEIQTEEIKKLKINAYLNLAVCYYKINKPKYVIRMLDSLENNILDTDRNCKALFYYGRAYEAMGKTDTAIEYYKKALKLEPKNKDIGKAMDKLDSYIKESAAKEKEMWKSVFKTEKKDSLDVDDDFKVFVKDMFKDLCASKEYVRFDLPTGLNDDEVAFIKVVAEEFEAMKVLEEGAGRKKKVTIVRKLV